MLYVFLDVDGVLNVKTNEGCGIKDVSMFCVRRLVEALEDYTDVHIVLTSEWRKWFHLTDYCDSYLKSLQRYLRKYDLEICDKTNDVEYATRELQIKQYIKKNRIKNFIILDDEKYHYAFDTKELYLVDSRIGFSKQDVEKFKRKCFELYGGSLYEEEKPDVSIASFSNPFDNDIFFSFRKEKDSGIKVTLRPTERYQETGAALIRHLRTSRITDMKGVKQVSPNYEGVKMVGLSVRVRDGEFSDFLNEIKEEVYRTTLLDDVTEVLMIETEDTVG